MVFITLNDSFRIGWIAHNSRERESDGYIKYIWSFGNNGQAYIYGKDIEEWKHKAYDYIVFGKKDAELLKVLPGLDRYVKSKRIHERRLQFQRYVKSLKLGENHQRLQTLENLQSLQQLEALQRLEALHISYEDYQYQEGDVVYCDIPYEDTASYSGGFDHKKFYDWVDAQPFPIYISSYRIKDARWPIVWAKCKVPLLNQQTKTHKFAVECLYKSK